MKVSINNLVYFISKGTVSLCLPKEYGEKEIKEVKKHHNFGEIEMCLSEKLKYNMTKQVKKVILMYYTLKIK